MTNAQYTEIFENHDIHPRYKDEVIIAMREAVEKGSIEFTPWFNRTYMEFMASGRYMKQFTQEELKEMDGWPDFESIPTFTIEEVYQEYLKSLSK